MVEAPGFTGDDEALQCYPSCCNVIPSTKSQSNIIDERENDVKHDIL